MKCFIAVVIHLVNIIYMYAKQLPFDFKLNFHIYYYFNVLIYCFSGSALLKKTGNSQHFVLNHFQGTNPVLYNTKGWLRASRENPLSRIAITFLQDSKR